MEQALKPARAAEPEMMAAAGSIGAAILISRVLGLIRDVVQARYFGAGMYTDAFSIAFRIPNLLRDLFAEGALSSAFIPTFIRRLTEAGKEQAWLLANRVLSALLVILGALTLVFYFGARWFVYLLAAGFAATPEKFDLTVQMTRILSPFLLCVALASVMMGILNACKCFFIPAMASSVFNVCCIAGGVLLSPLMPRWGLSPIVSMAIGAMAGGAGQFLVMVPSACSRGFRFRFSLSFSDPGVRQIGRLMLPAVVGLSAMQINITVDSQIASMFGNGPVSWLYYGFRLMQFPIGIFGIAVATVTTASVSHYAVRNEIGKLCATLSSGLRLAACLTFPATVGLVLYRQEIVRLIYEGDSFLPVHTEMTGRVVLLYALGLFSYSAVKILVPAFYALNDTRTPVRISLVAVAAKIALNFAFLKFMGFLGLALATTAASWLNFVLLRRGLRKKTGQSADGSEMGVYWRMAAASAAMGLISWIVFRGCFILCPGSGWFAEAFRLGAAIAAGIFSFFPLLRVMKVEEGRDVLRLAGTLIGKLR